MSNISKALERDLAKLKCRVATGEVYDVYQDWADTSSSIWINRANTYVRVTSGHRYNCTYCHRRNPASAYVCEGCGAPLE